MFVRQRLSMLVSREDHADLLPLTELLERGVVTPTVDATFRLADAREAMRRLEDGTVRGKLVIVP
jgi:NADPH:quinone reductase-like Zn-dependent oxidoreductase